MGSEVRPESGAVALESVLLLPVVLLLVGAVLATTGVVVDHLAVARAARAAARSVALTGEVGTAASVARAVHPSAVATVRVVRGVAHVEVRVDGAVVGRPYAVDATAAAPLEPGAVRAVP